MSEEKRIGELLATGDVRGAATEAIRALGPGVLRYLRATLRTDGQASDAFSRFAENVWKGISQFRGDGSLRIWALRVARNAAIDEQRAALRRRSRRLATSEASRLAEEVRSSSADPAERRRRDLEALRGSLAPGDQALLTLRLDQELTWDEIAEVVSDSGRRVSPEALMKRFERLRARLAGLARERGLVA